MRYGRDEYTYAAPFANALASNPVFKSWVLHRTRFAPVADMARLMHDEMKVQRSRSAESWWRSHYTERCRCPGCGGQETDLLAIFDIRGKARVALHVEVKQPTDNFPTNKDQASAYRLRANCWVKSPPPAVLPHHAADTMLLFSASRRRDYAAHLLKFDAVITFEEIIEAFPTMTIPGSPVAP